MGRKKSWLDNLVSPATQRKLVKAAKTAQKTVVKTVNDVAREGGVTPYVGKKAERVAKNVG